MTYDNFFRGLTEHEPYLYQRRIQEHLADGKSVILRAPTGSGKTWSVVGPFLYARVQGDPIADRLLYALPLRALATNIFQSTCEKAKADVKLQIGGDAQDPFFESDIVFTTIDQLLSSYLMMPVALSPRLDNINAGALPGALIVIDEAHLLDPDVALGTMIEMLDRLRAVSQFVVMTATLSGEAVNWLAAKLGAEMVSLTTEEIADLPSQRGKQRTWKWNGSALSADRVLDVYQGGRAIVLCNTVSKAQRIFRDLESKVKTETTLLLLHARFFASDRQNVESQLTNLFGPKSKASDVILVTTQVIEAGVDISAEQMHTELAPMNALVQRAGRVARYPDRNVGTVTVYDVESPLPYKQPILDATRQALIDGVPEELWIDRVHAGDERRSLAVYSNLVSRRKQVHHAMDVGDRGDLSELVRDISSINILVTDTPKSIELTRGKWPQTLSVSVESLGRLRSFFERRPGPSWVAMRPVDGNTDEESGPPKYEWQRVESFGEAQSQWLLALNPEVAYYDPRVGLVLGEAGPSRPIEYVQRPPRPRYQYTRESWIDHALRVKKQAADTAYRYQVAASRLAKKFGDVEWLVLITCALHDAGKLSEDWQRTAWEWQRTKEPACQARALAHTTWQLGDRRVTFPHHAVEGALMIAPSLVAELQKRLGGDMGPLVARAVCSAIARHHSPRAEKPCSFPFDTRFTSDLAAAAEFPLVPIPKPDIGILTAFPEELLRFNNFDHCEMWVLYVLLVRRLRLADQAATSAATDATNS